MPSQSFVATVFAKLDLSTILDFGLECQEQFLVFSLVGKCLPSFNFIAMVVLEKKKFKTDIAVLRKQAWRPSWILNQNALNKLRCLHR